jgi:phytoene synthase
MNDALHAPLAAYVRKHDPDRFLTVLFAPPDKRDALLTLYAVNNELARARAVVSEPPLALIRLQWWREVVEGTDKRHEIASPLTEALKSGALHRDDLMALIEARDQEAYGEFLTLDDWRGWMLAGAGGLAVAAARALGASNPEASRPYGAAYGTAALLRATGQLATRGRCLVPQDLLAQQGLSPEGFVYDPSTQSARPVLDRLQQEGTAFLKSGKRLERQAVPAALPAVLARRDFRLWPGLHEARGLADKLAVVVAGVTGRI